MKNFKEKYEKMRFNDLEMCTLESIFAICRYAANKGYTMPKNGIEFLMKFFKNDKYIIAQFLSGGAMFMCEEIYDYEFDNDISDEEFYEEYLPCSAEHWIKSDDEMYFKEYDEDNPEYKAIRSIIRMYRAERKYNK